MGEYIQQVNGTFVLPENFTLSNHTDIGLQDPKEHIINVAVLTCVGFCVLITLGLSFYLVCLCFFVG